MTVAANWDLPPELLQRQSQRELQRAVMELQRSGSAKNEIRAHENDLRQNSRASTARRLKEHFILERIAEEEKIEDDARGLRRRNRADRRAERRDAAPGAGTTGEGRLMDVLRNQIIERKVIDLILAHAEFKEVPYKPEGEAEAEAVDWSAGGEQESEIPEAKLRRRSKSSGEAKAERSEAKAEGSEEAT